jgi:hypothetical protein
MLFYDGGGGGFINGLSIHRYFLLVVSVEAVLTDRSPVTLNSVATEKIIVRSVGIGGGGGV